MAANCDLTLSPFFWDGFWVFVGVVAGTVVNILTGLVVNALRRRRILNDLEFEIDFNLRRSESWLKSLDAVLQASNSDNLLHCFEFFDFKKILTVAVTRLINDGRLYEFMTHDDIEVLQKFAIFCTDVYSTNLNEAIGKIRTSPNRQEMAQLIDFWKKLITEHRDGLRSIKARFDKKK